MSSSRPKSLGSKSVGKSLGSKDGKSLGSTLGRSLGSNDEGTSLGSASVEGVVAEPLQASYW